MKKYLFLGIVGLMFFSSLEPRQQELSFSGDSDAIDEFWQDDDQSREHYAGIMGEEANRMMLYIERYGFFKGRV